MGQKWRKQMGKNNEMQLWKRDHFESKIDKLLEPEIEREDLKLKATINKILDKGVDSFSKSIGADKVIAKLKKAVEEKRQASRLAYTFFNNKASSIVSYSKAKDYKFDRDDKETISVNDCTKQLEKWAEKQAEQFAKTTPQGQRLSFLETLRETCKDKVKEATVSDELKATLDNLMKMVGVSWERKLPALLPSKK